MKKILAVSLVIVLLLSGALVACSPKGPSEYDELQDENLALVAMQMAYLAQYFPGLVVDVSSGPPGVARAVERIGILDAQGYGVTIWSGGDISVYSDMGSTQTFALDGATGILSLTGPIGLSDGPGTATPMINVQRSSAGDYLRLVDATTTPVVNYLLGKTSAQINVDLDQNARVHVQPAATPAATTTPDMVVRSSNAANNVWQVENTAGTPVAYINYAGATTLGALSASSGTFSGAVAANGGLSVDSSAFTVADTTGNVATAGTLDVTGATTLTAAVAALGGISVTGFDTFVPATVITVTQDMTTFVPTGTYQPIASVGNVSFNAIGGKAAGRLLILINTTATTITITDTGTIMLSGNAVLGQYDTLTLFSDGTNWLQLSKGDN